MSGLQGRPARTIYQHQADQAKEIRRIQDAAARAVAAPHKPRRAPRKPSRARDHRASYPERRQDNA